MIEVTEFPHHAVRYEVRGVPLTVINETVKLTGSRSEAEVATAVLKAIGK